MLIVLLNYLKAKGTYYIILKSKNSLDSPLINTYHYSAGTSKN